MKERTLASLKPYLLADGTAVLTGIDPPTIKKSHAGPGVGQGTSIFFTDGISRIRLTLCSTSRTHIENSGHRAILYLNDTCVHGSLEPAVCHCPKQAYLTLSEGCIFSCRYCAVPGLPHHIKSEKEILTLLTEAVIDGAECISITSGVLDSPEQEAERLYSLLPTLRQFNLPIGISVYPTKDMPEKLHALGVSEVKFNTEAATSDIFTRMCPGLNKSGIDAALIKSVDLFGRNHVYTNIIIGLGETDEEMKQCISSYTEKGIIPILRPLTPSAELTTMKTPSPNRILKLASYLHDELTRCKLDITMAKTMCARCGACDLIPGIDL